MACAFAVYHQRNLPHYYPPQAILFVTWRLYGSLPLRVLPNTDAGRAFAEGDRLLDNEKWGVRWLGDSRVASIVAATLDRGEYEYRLYERFAWVVMPNHVHLVLQPFRPLPRVIRWVKGSSARQANILLGRTGKPFWAYESYDRCVRSSKELNRVIRYIENNPVKAALVSSPEDWPWSSANAGQKAYATRSF